MKIRPIAIAALVAACGGGGGGIGIDRIDEEYADAFCAKLFECCSDAEAMQFGMILGFTDEASCKTAFQMDFDEELVELRARVDSGELTYHGDAAAECVSLLDNGSCAQLFTPSGQTACDLVFTGMIANGQTCSDDEDCQSAFCETNDLGASMCAAVPGQNQPCTTSCGENLTCANGTCITPKADGDSCTSSDECRSGECDATCVPQTTCDGNDAS